jgi:hypothetical protein
VKSVNLLINLRGDSGNAKWRGRHKIVQENARDERPGSDYERKRGGQEKMGAREEQLTPTPFNF